VGFNEPPCGPAAPCRCLALSAATRAQNAAAFGGDAAAVPHQAITLGLAEILAAGRILLVVTGAAKAEMLRRALLEPPCPQVPASWLQGHPRLEVLVDGAAAADLPPDLTRRFAKV
jgi:glucosamine-6-phosphate deaminase